MKALATKLISYSVLWSLIALIPSCRSTECGNVKGYYEGESRMGATLGSASLEIFDDCSARLEYRQEGLGGAKESGEIHHSENGMQFKSKQGGTYDLQLNGDDMTLTGSGWKAQMKKGTRSYL